jgi:hypothetical protein
MNTEQTKSSADRTREMRQRSLNIGATPQLLLFHCGRVSVIDVLGELGPTTVRTSRRNAVFSHMATNDNECKLAQVW